jgi:autotransporter translocation and assembly factor TamB
VYFADLVEKEIVNLEDTLFVTLIDTSLTASRESAAAFLRRQGLGADFENRVLDSLRVDSLQLEMGSDVWLRSSEANIQLTGQVVAGKIADQYRLDGTLNTPRGIYRLPISRGTFLGDFVVRDFTVTDGTVQYFGTPDLDAAVDINARHVVHTNRGDNIQVFVNVGGTLYAPDLTLTSDFVPALPEPEIISYLLFGASSVQALGAEPAGTQGRQNYLEFAAAQFLGGAVSGELERSLISDLGVPIDYLRFRPELGEGLTGFEVAVGRQFGSRAFVTVSPRFCASDQTSTSSVNVGISAEFRLSRQWHLAASSDPVRGCGLLQGPLRQVQQIGLDLFWEKRY